MAATTTATHRPRTLVSAWLFLSSLVVAWDIGYILLRPRSMLGGDLHWIWSPYALYQTVDYVYGLPSWESKDGFPAAQSLLNVVESILNFIYLYLAHVKATPRSIAVAPLWGLVAATMTLSKTVLYVLNVSHLPCTHLSCCIDTDGWSMLVTCRITVVDGARRVTTTGTRSSSSGLSPTASGFSSLA